MDWDLVFWCRRSANNKQRQSSHTICHNDSINKTANMINKPKIACHEIKSITFSQRERKDFFIASTDRHRTPKGIDRLWQWKAS